MSLKHLVIALGIVFWPLHLFLKNTPTDFLSAVLPAIHSKLALLPLLIVIFYILFYKRFSKIIAFFLVITFILFAVNFKPFWGQTIFNTDYEAEQFVIRQTQLYPNIFLARLMHNKGRIYLDKFNNNFFALTDPNNYFFRFHPRQIMVDNQNLKKFPSFAFFFVILGLLFFSTIRYKRIILISLCASVLSLSLLTVFDRNDFILWIPLSLIFIHGVNFISNKKYARLLFSVFIVFSLLELIQIIVQSQS